jgi:hypothetical protein
MQSVLLNVDDGVLIGEAIMLEEEAVLCESTIPGSNPGSGATAVVEEEVSLVGDDVLEV